MSTVKITLDKRGSNTTTKGKFPLVLRLGHHSKTRDIPFGLHLAESQFDTATGQITGIANAARHTKRTQKMLADIDLWLDEEASNINLWSVDKLKATVEQRFFKQQSTLSLLFQIGKYLKRQRMAGKFSTAKSYEDAAKAFIKYRMKVPTKTIISTLFEKQNADDANEAEKGLVPLPEYERYDMPIRTIDAEYVKNFAAYLSKHYSRNSKGIILRSLNAMLNDAEGSYEELKGHTPLAKIKKKSYPNAVNSLGYDAISAIRALTFEPDTLEFHSRSYSIFMYDNRGMNFMDLALIKVRQFDGERMHYSRKKTEEEGDYFSIKQSKDCLAIIHHYMQGKGPDDYLFPILNKDTQPERIHAVKNDRMKVFNKYLEKIAAKADVKGKVSTYALRDSWVNNCLELGINLQDVSDGLGHSSIEVIARHYKKKITQKKLDAIDEQVR